MFLLHDVNDHTYFLEILQNKDEHASYHSSWENYELLCDHTVLLNYMEMNSRWTTFFLWGGKKAELDGQVIRHV